MMAELVATASCTAYRAAVESTGEVVGERELVRRVTWLTTLVRAMAAQVVAQRWTAACLAELAAGTSADGRDLPAKGWMAMRRLGWGCTAPQDVYVSERVRRVAASKPPARCGWDCTADRSWLR